MGEVWKAEHRMLKRPAAIKLIRPDAMGIQNRTIAMSMVHRFEREAQVTATLHSPHSIQLYDFGISDDGSFFYVMELLDGIDLQTLVEKYGPLPYPRTLYFLKQVCDSLMDAHQSGLIHRDIKPANIFLCRYGHRYDFIKVLDFGMVKFEKALPQEEMNLTGQGMFAGTPLFMAPEMAIREGKIDNRFDIYAVGCVAYWLLTGQYVFEAESALQVIFKHVHEPPVPPSQRTDGSIPLSLDRTILSCLEKDPANRPQSVEELSRRLCEVPVTKGWTDSDAQEWWTSRLEKSGAVRR